MKRNAVTVYGFVLGSQMLAVLEDEECVGEDTEKIIYRKDAGARSLRKTF